MPHTQFQNVTNQDVKDYFDSIGFRWFSHQELKERYEVLVHQLRTGIDREPGTPKNDDGVAALPSYAVPIQESEVTALADDTVAITAACGGTNWIFTVARKTADGTVILDESISQPIPEYARKHTFDSLMNLISDNVVRVAKQYNVQDTPNLSIGIAFGFPQTTLRLPNGDIDCRITQKHLPKKWVIEDCDESLPAQDQPSLADLLRQKVTAAGITHCGRIAIINDTVAVALDVQHASDLPVGFVFGTGTNAAANAGDERGIINLECGWASFEADALWKGEMVSRGYVDVNDGPIVEQWTGGGMLPYRIAAALYAADAKGLIKNADRWAQMFLHTENQALISHLADGDFADLRFAGATEDEKDLLRSVARRALTQAGQTIGIMIAAVSTIAGYTDGEVTIPYEGSLLKKGHGVYITARDTVELLLPGSSIKPYTASGMIGVAKLAMVLSNAK